MADTDLPELTVNELAALNISNRFTRLADALERLASAAERGAAALESIDARLSCLTEEVTGEDGNTRCTIRVFGSRPGELSAPAWR